MSWVYFVRRDDGCIKIGYSGHPNIRVSQLRGEHGDLGVLALMPGGRTEEAALHDKFASLRIGKTEWFRPEPPLVTFVWEVPPLSIDEVSNGWKDVRVTLDAELHARVVAAKGETSWQELVATWAAKWLRSLPATEAK